MGKKKPANKVDLNVREKATSSSGKVYGSSHDISKLSCCINKKISAVDDGLCQDKNHKVAGL